MTLDDALNELGIDRDAGADGARRAYLRLLKKRKPEVDREGFMRLREAYELVKPHFERLEMFRAIETAANEPTASGEATPDVVRIETPAGVVWVHRNTPRQTTPDEPIVPVKPTATVESAEAKADAPSIEPVVPAADPLPEPLPATDDVPTQALPDVVVQAPEAPVVPPATDTSPEPPEPSVDELIAAGKLKKAARRMGREFRESMQQGMMEGPVSSPHDALMLMLRLHEKNRVEEARALEKDFADWLAATGVSVRLMAGQIGVVWLMARELSALSNKFPSALRTGIAKSLIASNFDEIKRRASSYQRSDPNGARDAALDLHAHAPTLARMLADALSPREHRPAPVRQGTGSPLFISLILVGLMNMLRVCGSSSDTTADSYKGKSEPAYNRPRPPPSPLSEPPTAWVPPSLPQANTSLDPITPQYMLSDAGPGVDDDVKMDYAMSEDMVKQARKIEEYAMSARDMDGEKFQRAKLIRLFVETASCRRALPEMRRFVIDSSASPFSADVKKLDKMLRAACSKKDAANTLKDGGTKKP